MSTIQERKVAPEHQDFKLVSETSKDVMDAIKESASTARSETTSNSAESSPGKILKESLTQTYKGVPSSLEAESLQSISQNMSTLQERKADPEQQDFKHVSQASKDVMDSIKYSASTTRSEYTPSSTESKSGQILKESMSQTYRGVPSSLEAESLQKTVTEHEK